MSEKRRVFLNDQRALRNAQQRDMQQILEEDVSSDNEEAKKRIASYPPVSHEEAKNIVSELLGSGSDPSAYPWDRLEYCVKHLRYWINMQDEYTLSLASNERIIGLLVMYFEAAVQQYVAAIGASGDTAPAFTIIYEVSWLLSSLSYYSHTAEQLLYQKYDFLMETLAVIEATPASETVCIIILNITSSKQIKLTPMECVTISRFFYRQLISVLGTFSQTLVAQKAGVVQKMDIPYVQRYATYVIGNIMYALIAYYEGYFSCRQQFTASDDDGYDELDYSADEELPPTCYYDGRAHHPYMCPHVVAGAGVSHLSPEDEHKLSEDFASQPAIHQAVFLFRSAAHVFEITLYIFICTPCANGSFLNRLLYLIGVLLEESVITHWSCTELSLAYSVPFMEKLFGLLGLNKRNQISLVISVFTKVLKSVTVYHELQYNESSSSCEDTSTSMQVQPGVSLRDITYKLYDAPSSPDTYTVLKGVFARICPLIFILDTHVSSRISLLLTHTVTHFHETIYLYEDLFVTFLGILRGLPVNKVVGCISNMANSLVDTECADSYSPETWRELYCVLVHFFVHKNTPERHRETIGDALIRLLETYQETASHFLWSGGERMLTDFADHSAVAVIGEVLASRGLGDQQ